MTSSPLRRLPSVDAVLRHPDVAALAGALPRPLLADLVRDELAAGPGAHPATTLTGRRRAWGWW